MPKRFLLALLTAFLFCSAVTRAQFRYTFKDTTTPYAPLTGATTLNNGLWYGDNFVAPMPFSWKMDSTIAVTGMPLLAVAALTSDTSNFSDLNGFLFADLVSTLLDRGNVTGTGSISPIRYVTVGTAPSRIFKLEIANAGFDQEFQNYSTLNDSVNIQLWVYETSNIIELHYGSSRITHPGDYFLNGSGPFIAYMNHVDFNTGSAGEFYYIKSSGIGTGIDSVDINTLFSSGGPANILSSWPQSGRVFRFMPRGPACIPPVASFMAGTPSGKTVQYTYTGTTAIGLDSLVWYWGDGAKQKVTASYTTPLSHTFTNAGYYAVTLIAYSSCGNSVVTKQSSVSVGDLAALGNIKVYPNPATDLLTIEGLVHGGDAIVRSALGQIVLRSGLSNGRETLRIADLPAGVYSLSITDATGASGIVRFTKQ